MADPKNKWKQPAAPPPPMFFGKKERDLVKQVNDELAERVVGQTIAYYPISIEDSNFNDIYGEAIEKVSLPPVRVYAYVAVDNEQSNERYGYEYESKLTVSFHRKRLTEDQDLFVRVGDFIQYGDNFYEIVRTYNDTRYYFGQVEHKFQVSAECIRARHGSFKVVPTADRDVEVGSLELDGSDSPAPREAVVPPVDADYVTISLNQKLVNGRYLVAGENITIEDGGRQGPLTINSIASGSNAIGPTGSVQFHNGSNTFSGSSDLLFLTASNTLSIDGNVSASFGITASSGVIAGDLEIQGMLIGGSPLKISGSVQIIGSDGEVIAVLGEDSTGAGMTALSASLVETDMLTASTYVSASTYYGDGSNLSNLPTAGLVKPINSTQAYLTSSLVIGSVSAPDHQLSVSGSVSASVNISASAFYGDGSNLTGIGQAVGQGAIGALQFVTGSGGISGSTKVLYDYTNDVLTMNTGLVHNRTMIASNYTASITDYILGITSVPVSIEFDASMFSEGQVVVVKDETGLASDIDSITLVASGSQTVDGNNNIKIDSPYGAILLYSNGSNWFIY